MRVLIVATNISRRMGGEAVLPYHYARELAALGLEVHALTHARVREEIQGDPVSRVASFHFVEDAPIERAIHRVGRRMPAALRQATFSSMVTAITLARLARRARQLEAEIGFDVIHQPTPVSPRFPSFLGRTRAPLVIGPLNGGMSYPPAFAKAYGGGAGWLIGSARAVSGVANRLIPGKRRAARVLVANPRTRDVLPGVVSRGRVEQLPENGVDLALWSPAERERPPEPTFVYVGRLVWWKAVELLLEAHAGLEIPSRLRIVGDGPERGRLERLAGSGPRRTSRVEFLGFRAQEEIREVLASATALVLPSLRECGGAVVLEAFACGTPVIATDWGGPREYVSAETGLLVAPDGRDAFVRGLREAMLRLAKDPALAEAMGAAGRRHVEDRFSWRAKAVRMHAIYRSVAAAEARPGKASFPTGQGG